MKRLNGKFSSALGTLIGMALTPAAQLYWIGDRKRRIQKATQDAERWQAEHKTNTEPETERLSNIFNSHASKLEDTGLVFVCHTHQDRLKRLQTSEPHEDVHIFQELAGATPTTDKNRYIISMYADYFKDFTEEEISFVMCHEMAHIKNKDFDKGKNAHKLTAAFNIAVLAGAAAMVAGASPVAFTALAGSRLAYSLYKKKQRRDNEFAADKTAITSFNTSPEAAKSALQKLQADGFGQESSNGKFKRLLALHPPVSERIKAIESVTPA